MNTSYTAWNGTALERRSVPVIGASHYAASFGFGFLMTLIGGVVMLLSLGCGSADTLPSSPTEMSPEPQHESFEETPTEGLAATPEPVAAPLRATTRVMYVDPENDADLLLLVARTIERVEARTGALIEIREGGIPVRIGGSKQGQALTDTWCAGGDCGPELGTRVWIQRATVDRIYVDNFADNSLAHEFAHVLSGWGHCSTEDVDGHLEPGHIVANGNTGYGQMSWTDADTRLTCSCGACP